MARSKIKGGGTKKVCLPAAKVRSMSKAERNKVVRAKRKAAASGKYKRSSKSNVKGGTEADGKFEELQRQLEELENKKPSTKIIVKEVKVDKKGRKL